MMAALSSLQARVDVPILLPTPLPAGARLDRKDPTSFYRNGDEEWVATLNLTLAEGGSLEIAYGAPQLNIACVEDAHIRSTHVGEYPALLATTDSESQVVWPATNEEPQGNYRLISSLTGPEILHLARTMEPVPGLEPTAPAPAC